MEGYWEFMGGKQEERETGEEAAIREIGEELGTDISVDSRLCTITHQYSHGLLSFSCGKTRRNIWPSDDLIRTPS